MENPVVKPSAKKSFVEKVIEFLKGGDDKKISRFYKRTVKEWQKQIRLREDEIEVFIEKISDMKESQEEALFDVDVSKIKTTESLESYIVEYSERLSGINSAIEEAYLQIENKKKEIEQFKKLLELVD